MDATKEYKVFISYSWTTPEHEKWVHNLALRLMENGIDVKLDKWDLAPGQDKYAYMESMVKDNSIDKVLIICDRGYKQKADNRENGVGTETQIITPEIYNNTQQDKFIPIISEKGDTFDSFIPVYLKSRIGIDMSSEICFEDGYDRLLRLIAERPLYRKPEKGQLPSYLFADEKYHFKTKNIIKQLQHSLINKPEQARYFILDFIDEFKKSLQDFKLKNEDMTNPQDEVIYCKINDMIDLRNDYINFLSILCRSGIPVNVDILINLFEEMYQYTEFQENGIISDFQFDHFKFFVQELFLYTTVLLIENELFDTLNILLSSKYFVKVNYRNENGITFPEFRFYISSIDEVRNKRLGLRKVSLVSELLIERSIVDDKNYKDKLLQADLLLHYISCIKYNDGYSWFPDTYIYYRYGTIDILRRLVSKRNFEKIKKLFNVTTVDEMKALISNFKNQYRGHNNSFESIPNINKYIKVEDICTFE